MNTDKKCLYIGITGGIGSGKSAVSSFIKSMGYPLIDADIIARRILDRGTKAYADTVTVFGVEILRANGDVNRERLGEIIFNDSNQRQKLNDILHPAIYDEMERQYIEFSKAYSLVFADIPLLIENNRMDRFDEVWVVYAPEALRVARIMERDSVEENYARVKIAAQMSLDEKKKFATRVFYNDSSLEVLKEQVEEAVGKLRVR